MSGSKVWFITGTSRGFGKVWARAALDRGDRVVATARNIAALEDLSAEYGDRVLPLQLDVTDHERVKAAFAQAHRHFGRLDVVLASAGYGLLGSIEEVTIEDARANFETNVIGTISILQAALPLLREQGGGHILAVSSIGGLVALPTGAVYQATKFAVEAILQTLASETEGMGIKVTLIEPGPFATDFMTQNSVQLAQPMPVYERARQKIGEIFNPDVFGDPADTVKGILAIVDAEEPPLQAIFGPVLPIVKEAYEARIASWEKWEPVTGYSSAKKRMTV